MREAGWVPTMSCIGTSVLLAANWPKLSASSAQPSPSDARSFRLFGSRQVFNDHLGSFLQDGELNLRQRKVRGSGEPGERVRNCLLEFHVSSRSGAPRLIKFISCLD